MQRVKGFAAAAALLIAAALAPLAGGVAGTVMLVVAAPCRIDLVQGWNFISLCSESDNKTVSSILAGVDYRYVMAWNESAQEFDIYSPRAASNPFDSFEFNQSYFVYAFAPASIYVGRNRTGDLNISLSQGWSGPSYPYEFGTNISNYFNATAFRYLMKWNATSQEFMIYSPRAASNPFTKISPTEGQLIYGYPPSGYLLQYNRTALNSS